MFRISNAASVTVTDSPAFIALRFLPSPTVVVLGVTVTLVSAATATMVTWERSGTPGSGIGAIGFAVG